MENIALNIVLNGIPTAVGSLKQFEETLAQARIELSNLTIGSNQFKKLSSEIKTADNTLRELKKRTEGKDLEGRLGDFGKLGGAIGGSFAAATAAVQLFGDGSEESLKAVTQAQNALTIGLAARGAAEGIVVIKTIATDIATKALAASTASANSITKAFYLTLSKNPYGVLIAALGALILAFITFTSKTDDAIKKQKEFNDALNKDISKEVSSFEVLANRVSNVALSLETRNKAIDDLRKLAPNYFKDLTNEQILQSNLKKTIDEVSVAIEKQTTARAIQARLAEDANKIIEIEDKLTLAVKARTQAELILQKAVEGGIGTGQGQSARLIFASNLVTSAIAEQKSLQEQLIKLNQSKIKDINEIKRLEGEIDKILGGQFVKEEAKTEEKEKQVLTNTRLIAQEKELQGILENLKAALSFESISEPTIIKEQEKIITNFQSIADKLKSISPDIADELDKILNPKVLINQEDVFKTILDSTFSYLLQLEKIPVRFKDIETIFKNSKAQGNLDLFTDEQKADLVSFFNTLKNAAPQIVEAFKQINVGITTTEEEAFAIFSSQLGKKEALLKRVTDGEITAAQARIELERGLLVDLSKKLGIDVKILEGQEVSNELLTKRFNEELKNKGVLEDTVNIILDGVEALVNFSTEVDKQGAIITKNSVLIAKQIELIKTLFKGLGAEDTGKLLQSFGLSFESGLQFVLKNSEKFGAEISANLLKGVATLEPELDKLSLKQLRTFKKTNEDLVQIFKDSGLAIGDSFDKVFEKVDMTIKEKLIESILTGIQQFQAVLNTLSQTTANYFSAQFDVLDKRYKRIQEGIIGDTVVANQKRLESEKAYLAEKSKLEKRAARTSLSISLAQSIANTAEAITKLSAITGGVGAIVAGGLIAGLNAVQTGIIAQQLANLNSYQRGGMIKKKQGGGFVSGPSHEYGGVKFQGGGIELEGNESIINRVSTINYMGLLDQINQSGGGKPIYPNYDDSRIVEAIAKQRNTPIRAYVVESDITAKQETARRMERLSQI